MSYCVEFGENTFNFDYTFKNRTHYKQVGSFSFSSIMTCELESWLPLQANKYPQVMALFIAKVTCRSLHPLLWTAVATQESNLVPLIWCLHLLTFIFKFYENTSSQNVVVFFFFFWNMLWLWLLPVTSCDEDYLNCLFVEHSVRDRICCNNHQ